MKKKFILGLILGIFLIGFVSASISGYLVRGTAISDSGYTATLQKVDAKSGVVTVSVETPSGTTEVVRVREGQTAKVGDAEIRAFDLKQGTLFVRGGGNVDLNVSPVPTIKSGVGTSSGLLSVTEEECFENCQTFTEVYKLEEGQTININGNTISIDYIDVTQVVLMFNGQTTPLLSEDQKFQLNTGQMVVIKDIHRLEIGGEIGRVELGVLSSYTLKEGEQISIMGDTISIDYIDTDSVQLNVNGQITSDMPEGQTFELSSGQMVVIKDIHRLEIGGEIGRVELDPASCYFPYL